MYYHFYTFRLNFKVILVVFVYVVYSFYYILLYFYLQFTY